MSRVTGIALSLLYCSLCAAIASGCGGEDHPAGGTKLVGTQWVLDVSALGVSDAGSVTSWIEFARDRASGNDGCNMFTGSYETNGSSLTFGQLAGTLMACPGAADEVARKVTAALGRVRSYTLAGDALRLEDAGGRTLLSYTAGTPGVQGAWTVISVLYDDAIRSVAPDTHLTADFAADGGISGSTGCNSFHGDYTLDGTKLDIGPLAATKKACPSAEASKQEAGYLAALESAVRIQQIGPELTLFNANGQMAVTLTRR
jgi:heat shock protein HslJ